MHAQRLLGSAIAASSERVFPNYRAFDGDGAPSWWRQARVEQPQWGKLLGVHELIPGSADGAFIVGENGLGAVREERTITWVPYERIARWKPVAKDRITGELDIETLDGTLHLRFMTPGAALAFLRFLIAAIRAREHALTRCR